MNVTNIRSRTVKTYTITIKDGEVRQQPYSRSGQLYRVTVITVVKTDGNVESVALSGPKLKKDGADGETSASERLYRQSAWPNWLSSIVGGLA